MMMMLNVGPCMRLSIVKLVVLTSSLVVLPLVLFYWFGPTDSVSQLLISSTESASDPGRSIPPIPPWCPDESQTTTTTSSSSSTDADADSQRRQAKTARALLPKDLLCRRVDANSTEIPRILHQSWKTTQLPSKFERWSKTCRDVHPDWEWVLWTDDDNHDLVKTYFPWLEDTYLHLPGPIYRADFARNLYMYMFGGVYADLDLECLRPTEVLERYRIRVAGPNETRPADDDDAARRGRPLAVFGRLGTDESFEHSIPNAWMASTPRHPFFLLPLESARARVARMRALPPLAALVPSAERMTGPVALREAVLRWKSTLRDTWSEVALLPPELIYPFSWKTPGAAGRLCSTMSGRFDEARCKEAVGVEAKGSLAVTFWSHTHDGARSNEKNIASVSDD